MSEEGSAVRAARRDCGGGVQPVHLKYGSLWIRFSRPSYGRFPGVRVDLGAATVRASTRTSPSVHLLSSLPLPSRIRTSSTSDLVPPRRHMDGWFRPTRPVDKAGFLGRVKNVTGCSRDSTIRIDTQRMGHVALRGGRDEATPCLLGTGASTSSRCHPGDDTSFSPSNCSWLAGGRNRGSRWPSLLATRRIVVGFPRACFDSLESIRCVASSRSSTWPVARLTRVQEDVDARPLASNRVHSCDRRRSVRSVRSETCSVHSSVEREVGIEVGHAG